MKINALSVIIILTFLACNQPQIKVNDTVLKINGTWKLVSSLCITKGDTVNTSPSKKVEMIKIINDTHFAFFKHNLNKGKGVEEVYDSGSGTYLINGNNYIEHLEYCSAREWENHDFKFILKLKNDTLIQSGIEKLVTLKVDREIVEIYVRKK
ncbi:hypothetical protein [Pedobacter mendelii]|uniref:Lipocalin-like domain-containing protein n=1 Tax=Pedobacter mendelii TaxID=1908240 RepID=A0ABQ2BHW9_9SPHI|nr:hypothetical protein [Pedobacter mendelii]GGI24563.1 hypothetical protein GCM10008119_13280 [Pedobacter mendelii]